MSWLKQDYRPTLSKVNVPPLVYLTLSQHGQIFLLGKFKKQNKKTCFMLIQDLCLFCSGMVYWFVFFLFFFLSFYLCMSMKFAFSSLKHLWLWMVLPSSPPNTSHEKAEIKCSVGDRIELVFLENDHL